MFVIQLKSFFMVARLGSITLAAKHLGLSQPTVTTQIRALEEHYGIELFRRQGGRLVVSDDGVRLLPMVEALMQQESNVEFALRNAGDVNQGQLRLGTTAPYYILDIVKRFQDRYPRVDVVITMGNSRQTGEALREFHQPPGHRCGAGRCGNAVGAAVPPDRHDRARRAQAGLRPSAG